MGDTSKSQLSLLPEGADQLRAVLHGPQAAPREVADLGDRGRAQVGNFVFLQVGPDRFDRIELGSVGRKKRDGDAAILLFEPSADEPTLVRADPVPDDQQLAANLPVQGRQEFDDLLALDGAREEAKIKAPPGQAGDRRHLLPGEALLDDRGVPPQRPGARDRALLRQTRFVYEDDRSPLEAGLFFSAGQVLRFQAAIACSLRCVARFSGFCGVNPKLRNKCQHPTVEYSTSKRCLITARTRLMVHSSVGNPAVRAPVSKIARNPARCSSSSRRGRPNSRALSLPTAPRTASSLAAQRLTVCRDTCSFRATSVCLTPRFSSRAPCSRRASIASKSRFVPMRHPRQDTCRYNAQGYDSVVTHL